MERARELVKTNHGRTLGASGGVSITPRLGHRLKIIRAYVVREAGGAATTLTVRLDQTQPAGGNRYLASEVVTHAAGAETSVDLVKEGYPMYSDTEIGATIPATLSLTVATVDAPAFTWAVDYVEERIAALGHRTQP